MRGELRAVCANLSSAFPGQHQVRSLQDCIAEEKRSPATKAGLSLLAPAGSSSDHHLSSSLTSLDSTQASSQGDNILGRVFQQVLSRIRPPGGHISLGTVQSPAAPQADDAGGEERDTQVPTRLNTTQTLSTRLQMSHMSTRAGKAAPQGLTLDGTQWKKPKTQWEELGEMERLRQGVESSWGSPSGAPAPSIPFSQYPRERREPGTP